MKYRRKDAYTASTADILYNVRAGGKETNKVYPVNPHQLIGILGGSFDPIHLGHLHIANTLLQSKAFHSIHLVPCYQPVHRAPLTASPVQRLAMVKLAIAENKQLIANDCEISRGGPSYTVDTLQIMLKDGNKNNIYALILSTESFLHINTWKDWKRIPTLAHIIVVDRHGFNFPKINTAPFNQLNVQHAQSIEALSTCQAGLILHDTHFHGPMISSTDIRHQLSCGKTPSAALSPAVLAYIKETGLYTHY